MKDRCEDEITLRRTSRQGAGKPKKAEPKPPVFIPRITRLMALAIRFQDMIDRGELKDYADLARLGFVTRARVTQIMNLQLLAPDIQEKLLFLPSVQDRYDRIRETVLRRLCSEVDWDLQRRAWSQVTRAQREEQ